MRLSHYRKIRYYFQNKALIQKEPQSLHLAFYPVFNPLLRLTSQQEKFPHNSIKKETLTQK